MDLKKLLIGAVAGGIANMVMAYIVYDLLLGDFYQGQMSDAAAALERTEPEWLWLILGSVIMGGFLTYIFVRWAGIKTFAGGAKAGLAVGLFIGLGFNFIWYATMDMMSLSSTIVDGLVTGVWWAIVGGLIGVVLGILSKD